MFHRLLRVKYCQHMSDAQRATHLLWHGLPYNESLGQVYYMGALDLANENPGFTTSSVMCNGFYVGQVAYRGDFADYWYSLGTKCSSVEGPCT